MVVEVVWYDSMSSLVIYSEHADSDGANNSNIDAVCCSLQRRQCL